MGYMEVILVRTICHVGRAGDIVKVKCGYASNYLIPKQYALYSTPKNVKVLETRRQSMEVEEQIKYKNSLEEKKLLESCKIIIERNINESGFIYGSVTARDVEQELLKTHNISVLRQMISLKESVKKIGKYNVIAHLYGEVSANVELHVVPTGHIEELEKESKNTTVSGVSESDMATQSYEATQSPESDIAMDDV